MSEIVIVDASVFAKLVVEEDDSHEALAFFGHASTNRYFLKAPSLFLYEGLALSSRSEKESGGAYELLLSLLNAGFELVEIGNSVTRKALEISNTGHAKTGYPSFYDSAYHALALMNGGVFLTSDQRHMAKAAGFGSVVLLKDWRSRFQ
jgi:predicted nucleic acid-binding protein